MTASRRRRAGWIAAAVVWALNTAPQGFQQPAVRVGVFTLFKPTELIVGAGSGSLILHTDDDRAPLEGVHTARVRLGASGSGLDVEMAGRSLHASRIETMGRDGAAADVRVQIPGRIDRTYRGRLTVSAVDGALVPVMTMDLETAVAAATAAESAAQATRSALEAQAIVTRSYYASAGPRHTGFDFCDTTHCQFMRGAPDADAPATRAARQTRELVLMYDHRVVPALFSASCGGRTHTLADIGLVAKPGAYPFFSVACRACVDAAPTWTRTLSDADGHVLGVGDAPTERARVALTRRLGWDAVPSLAFQADHRAGQYILSGRGAGHGVGLCQHGALVLAQQGRSAVEILAHYFPGAEVRARP